MSEVPLYAKEGVTPSFASLPLSLLPSLAVYTLDDHLTSKWTNLYRRPSMSTHGQSVNVTSQAPNPRQSDSPSHGSVSVYLGSPILRDRALSLSKVDGFAPQTRRVN